MEINRNTSININTIGNVLMILGVVVLIAGIGLDTEDGFSVDFAKFNMMAVLVGLLLCAFGYMLAYFREHHIKPKLPPSGQDEPKKRKKLVSPKKVDEEADDEAANPSDDKEEE
jgi:hypothetical protein